MTFDLEKAKYDLDAYPEENRFEWTGDALDKIMDQMQEIERLQALNPFNVNTQVGIRINDNVFAYSDGESAAILQNLLLTKDARIQELKDDLETAKASLRFDKEEIERLQASLIDLHAEYINTLEKNPECSAWDLDEQSDADQRRLRKNAAHAISIVEPLIYLQADQRAVHVQELEDALVEERAQRYSLENTGAQLSQAGGQFQKRCRWSARLQLQAEGKIGPDASKSHLRPYEVVAADLAGRLAENRRKSWQITDERRDAIRDLLNGFTDDDSFKVLRAMLEAS